MRRTLLGVCLFIACATASPYAQTSSSGDTPVIVATGDVVLLHPPDRAYVQIGVEGTGGKSAKAEDEAAKSMTAVQAAIRSLGFGADAIKTVSFSVQPRYQLGGREYIARHVIEVRVDDLSRLAVLIDAAGESRAGSISSLRFDVKDRKRFEMEALEMAIKDATARAQAIAAGAGRTLGEIVRIQEQRLSSPSPVFRVAGEGAARVADGGRGGGGGFQQPIEPGEIQIRAQVTLTVAIKVGVPVGLPVGAGWGAGWGHILNSRTRIQDVTPTGSDPN